MYHCDTNERQGSELHMVKKEEGKKKQQKSCLPHHTCSFKEPGHPHVSEVSKRILPSIILLSGLLYV